MGVLIKKLNKIQVSGNFWPAVYMYCFLGLLPPSPTRLNPGNPPI